MSRECAAAARSSRRGARRGGAGRANPGWDRAPPGPSSGRRPIAAGPAGWDGPICGWRHASSPVGTRPAAESFSVVAPFLPASTGAAARRPGWWARRGGLGYFRQMDPARKRRIRLVVALSAALLLAGALAYTSFSASSEARSPSQLARSATPGQSYQLTGKVVAGSIRHQGSTLYFRVRDRRGTASVPIRYTGVVPDPFREGREVIVTVRKQGAVFVGERDSLVTKCPSKFTDKPSGKA